METNGRAAAEKKKLCSLFTFNTNGFYKVLSHGAAMHLVEKQIILSLQLWHSCYTKNIVPFGLSYKGRWW